MAWEYGFGIGPTGYGDGTTTNGWQPHNFDYGARLTFPAAGTVDQLGAYCSKGSGGNATLKMGLFDTSGNRIADDSALLTSSTQAWVDSGVFTAASVAEADYFVLTAAETEWVEYGYDSANDGTNSDSGYAAFPEDPATITAEEDIGNGYGRRANFTAGVAAPFLPIHARRENTLLRM